MLARTAEEALDLWLVEIPDLIIIDNCFATLDEIRLTERLRQERVMPILVITRTSQEGHLLLVYRAGADECVSRPLSLGLTVRHHISDTPVL